MHQQNITYSVIDGFHIPREHVRIMTLDFRPWEIVLASDGYPLSYEKGFEIKGLEKFDDKEDYYCFHAGTALKDGVIVTNGGRVLGVTAKGNTLVEARAKAYEATKWVDFDNKYMRNDIGNAILSK